MASETTGGGHEMQQTEIDFLDSVFDETERSLFHFDERSRKGSFTVFPKSQKPVCLIGSPTRLILPNLDIRKHSESEVTKSCYILHHLPPVILDFLLPVDYLSVNVSTAIPQFCLSCEWLPESVIKQLKDQLVDLALNNLGEMSLWICYDHLQNESFPFIIQALALVENTESFVLDLFHIYSIFSNEMKLPIENCTDYFLIINSDQLDVEFRASTYECPVCFETKFGRDCYRFRKCGEIICRECIRESFTVAVEEGLMGQRPRCLQCGEEAGPDEVRANLPPDLYSKYEDLLLKRGLSVMKDVVYCPRCETAVILISQNLGCCAACDFSFCPLCFRTYHGIDYCPGMDKELTKAERMERFRILKKDEKWISKNYKKCPGCFAPCEKLSGCNKMVCKYCDIYFCWLCGKAIHDRGNPYEHFRTGPCANLLFEGIPH